MAATHWLAEYEGAIEFARPFISCDNGAHIFRFSIQRLCSAFNVPSIDYILIKI